MTAGYRAWVRSQNRILVTLAPLFVLGVLGTYVDTIQATIGVQLTQVLYWAVLLLSLYTWGILVGSIVSSSE